MSEAKEYQSKIVDPITVTIADGATLSTAADLYGCTVVALYIPSGLNGTTLYFKSSHDGVNYSNMRNSSGARLTVTVVNSEDTCIAFLPADLFSTKHLKIEAATTQSGDIDIVLVARPV